MNRVLTLVMDGRRQGVTATSRFGSVVSSMMLKINQSNQSNKQKSTNRIMIRRAALLNQSINSFIHPSINQ
jgi:hypothetical protein